MLTQNLHASVDAVLKDQEVAEVDYAKLTKDNRDRVDNLGDTGIQPGDETYVAPVGPRTRRTDPTGHRTGYATQHRPGRGPGRDRHGPAEVRRPTVAGRLLARLVTTAVAGAVALPASWRVRRPPGRSATGSAVSGGSTRRQLKTWHQQGITGKGVTIALIDGPVATGIPELKGQDVQPTGTLCDRDQWRSWGPTTPDGPLNETSFHTTSMAALMVGSGKGNGPGGVGILGVAPGATLKTYAVFNTVDPAAHQNLACWGPGLPAFIDRIVADGAQVIQIPVSLDVTNDEMQAAFNRAIAKGVIVVAASGNGGPFREGDVAGGLPGRSRRGRDAAGREGPRDEPHEHGGRLGPGAHVRRAVQHPPRGAGFRRRGRRAHAGEPLGLGGPPVRVVRCQRHRRRASSP